MQIANIFIIPTSCLVKNENPENIPATKNEQRVWVSIIDRDMKKKSVAVELYQGCDRNIKYSKVKKIIEMLSARSLTPVFLRM